MKYFALALVLVLIALSTSTSEAKSLGKEEEIPCTAKLSNQKGRSGISGDRYRWNTGLNVRIDEAFSEDELFVIEDAIDELQSHLCIPINILPSDEKSKGDYVQIIRGESGSGCYAFVGRQGGKQNLNLQHNGCIYKYVVIHELIHSLGFYHEMSRPDRDDYVDIFFENIAPGNENNFRKNPNTLTFEVPYDFNSIMHYKSFDFAVNSKPTVLSKDGKKVGNKRKLTKYDIQKLKRMYNCE